MVPIRIKELEGCSVAVDTYSWLHKGALSCSKKLYNGVPATKSGKENLALAIEHRSNGNGVAAYEFYQKAIDITPSVAHELIQVLKKENISYVVALYEADAQLTFLAVSKQVSVVQRTRILYHLVVSEFGQDIEFYYSKLQENRELS